MLSATQRIVGIIYTLDEMKTRLETGHPIPDGLLDELESISETLDEYRLTMDDDEAQ